MSRYGRGVIRVRRLAVVQSVTSAEVFTGVSSGDPYGVAIVQFRLPPTLHETHTARVRDEAVGAAE